MKRILLFQMLLTLAPLFLLNSCIQDECQSTATFVQHTPVYKTLDEIRTRIELEAPRPLEHPGKLYYYDHLLLINEQREGIHMIDNTDPENPVNIGFLAIPGNVDMAMQDYYLYADNYIDLVTIDLSDPLQPRLVQRQEDIFHSMGLFEDLGHLVYYEQQEITRSVPCEQEDELGWWFFEGPVLWLEVDVARDFNGVGGFDNGGGPVTGTGGSMARFTIADQTLYTLNEWELSTFRIGNDGQLSSCNTLQMEFGRMETIFPYADKLFFGANNGMYIYDRSDPCTPVFLSRYDHLIACDPVFVKDDIAYVTLNGNGTACNRIESQLEVIDLENILQPRLIKAYPMDDPLGLSVNGERLYLCDGQAGLKVFGITDPERITDHLQAHFPDIHSYDVITLPQDGRLLVLLIGEDGFYQYDGSDPERLPLLSRIPVGS